MIPWHLGRLLAFDTETSGVEVDTHRIVTAAAILLGGGQHPEHRTWLTDVDGQEIPAEATSVHGITTEHAHANGMPARDAVNDIAAVLTEAVGAGATIVGHNVQFDLTLLDREMRRHLGYGLHDAIPADRLTVIDSMVLDRYAAPFRRRVSETQGPYQMKTSAQTYGLGWDDGAAHGAEYDAVMSARVAWRIGSIAHQPHAERPEWVRRLRTQRFNDLARLSVQQLHQRQIEWAKADAAGFQEWLRTKAPAEKRDPNAVIDGRWPLIPHQHTETEGATA